MIQLPHEWERDLETGLIKEFDTDHHSFIECMNCDTYECKHCKPDIYTEPCGMQTTPLMPIGTVLNQVQQRERFVHLRRLGYVMRNGEVVGWRDPVPECNPGAHKLRVASRTSSGEGINKRVSITDECIVCYHKYVRF